MTIPFDPGTAPIQQMMGMPKGKKTRRGKGGRGGKMQSDPASHMDAASKALAAGDHATAKKHAFALVRSLHASHPSSSGTTGLAKGSAFPAGMQSSGISSVPSQSVASAPQAGVQNALDPAMVRASRLVHALHAGRKK